MSWAVLAVAIAGIGLLAPVVARIRALASLRLPSHLRRRPAPPRLQAAIEDLFSPIEAELAELGFRFSHAAQALATPSEWTPWQPIRVFRHFHFPIVAQLTGPSLPELPNVPILSLLAELKDGPMVLTSNVPMHLFPADPKVQRLAGDSFPSVKDQYAAQLDAMRAEGLQDFLPWGDPEDIEARLGAYEQRCLQAVVQAGWCEPEGESLRIAPRKLPALGYFLTRQIKRLVHTLQQLPPQSPARKTSAPLERSLMLYIATHARPKHSPPAVVQWTLYGLSLALCLVLGGGLLGWPFAGLLLVVIALHEAGHYLALRALGYRHMQMLMLPLIGGVAFGESSHPPAWHRVIVSLAGPLPGLLLGAALLGWPPARPELVQLGWLLLLVNALNLLPLHPFDGGRVLEALLPARHVVVRIALEGLAVLGLLALWWFVGWTIAWALILLKALSWRGLWRQMRFERLYARTARARKPADARALARLAFQTLERVVPARASLRQRIGMVDELITQLRSRPLKGPWALGVAALHLAALALPLALGPQLVQVGRAAFMSEPERQALRSREHEALVRQWSVGELVLALSPTDPTARHAATPLGLATLQQRLGASLPTELIEVYRTRDGLSVDPWLQLAPIGDVLPLRQSRPRLAARLAPQQSPDGSPTRAKIVVECASAPGLPCEVRIDEVLGWWHVGHIEGQPLLLMPGRDGATAHWVRLDIEALRVHPQASLRELLSQAYLRLHPASPAPKPR